MVKATGQISTSSGTSLAAPLVTSLAAGIMQRYPDLTNLEVMTLMKGTASQAYDPDNVLGYGIPNFRAVVNFQERTSQDRLFEIYPNPLKDDTLTISPADPDLVRSCDIEIISAQGQLVGRKTVQFDWLNRNYKANLSGLPSGIYYIRVFHEKSRHTFRLIKL